MKVALIDSGIRNDLLQNAKVMKELIVETSGEIHLRSEKDRIVTAHGTTCAQIIESYVNKVDFYSLQIFTDVSERATCEQFLAALEWCFLEKIPIIHMSIGTTGVSDGKKLWKIVEKMIDQGQILVAAYSNATPISYPAYYDEVFGVFADSKLSGFEFQVNDIGHGMNFLASSRHILGQLDGKQLITPFSNSFAAPVDTAAICRILQEVEGMISAGEIYHLLTGKKAISKPPEFVEFEECLVLQILGQKNDQWCVLKSLFDIFSLDGYHCLVLTDIFGINAYGFEYIPTGSCTKDVLMDMTLHYNPDVILLGFVRKLNENVIKEAFTISVGDTEQKTDYQVWDSGNVMEIQNLYDYIVSHFS